MTDYPAPKLLVNETFKDTQSMSHVFGWDLDFRQLDPGPLCARTTLFGHEDIGVLRIEFDRSFHQVGAPPPGVVSFGFPDKESGVLRWNGIVTPPGVLINFNHMKKLDCVNQGPFGGYVLSFTEKALKSAAEKQGFHPDLVSKAVVSRFWNPDNDENIHNELRQVLLALEKIALTDGDEGLGRWKGVFNSEILNHLVRIIAFESSSPKMTGPVFSTRAMNRAVDILKDHRQFPMNIEALCVLAGASWASLQRAFFNEFGVSPSAYSKSRRLSAVQTDLIKTGPKVVIREIANQWGFWHMGNFAADYRKQFGELPSQTLQRIKQS